jgi:ribosomal protein S18 acetylase RimI-like enzyme
MGECETEVMSQGPESQRTYRKVPFEWTVDQVLSDRKDPTGIAWISSEIDDRFVDVVARSLAASLDTSDIASVRSMGSVNAARTLLESAPKWRCSREPDWWQLICFGGEPAGFVLPVTYDVMVQSGQPEGTIFHTGVAPEFRGRGLGRLLLRQAVRTLMNGDVRRIFCDTDATNAPMIHLFESEGWGRLPTREVPLPVGFEPRDL